MPSTAKSVSQPTGGVLTHLMVFDADPGRSAEMAGELTALGFRTTVGGSSVAAETFRREQPALAVMTERAFADPALGGAVRSAADRAGLPVLVVVDDLGEARGVADRLDTADDWVARSRLAAELPSRVARLLKRREQAATAGGKSGPALPSDSQFFALVVHDLRTPLNVIGLSLRMISQALPKGDPDLDEDMRFVDENFRQIERMLTQLSDFYRLFENDGQLAVTPFSPRRMADELLEARATKATPRLNPVLLDVRPNCPEEVDLDPLRARQAIQYALVNATAASGGEPIRVTMHGGRDRWVIEVAVDRPPPSSVQSVNLSSTAFERLCGFAAERRGMDLAIAAKVTEMFGGRARLDVVENQGTTIVLDWPARFASA